MIEFNRKNRTYSITIPGDETKYFCTVRAIARLIACCDEEALDKDTIYHTSTLLEEMLPGPGQELDFKP